MSDQIPDELRIYLVMRKDVGDFMTKEKFGVQCGHGTLSAWARCLEKDQSRAWRYLTESQPKIVLQAKDDKELLAIRDKANEAGFINELIIDAGRTEFAEPTMTVLAIGPIWLKTEARQSFIKRLRLYKSRKEELPPENQSPSLDSALGNCDD